MHMMLTLDFSCALQIWIWHSVSYGLHINSYSKKIFFCSYEYMLVFNIEIILLLSVILNSVYHWFQLNLNGKYLFFTIYGFKQNTMVTNMSGIEQFRCYKRKKSHFYNYTPLVEFYISHSVQKKILLIKTRNLCRVHIK